MLAVQAEHRGRRIGDVTQRQLSDCEATQLVESALTAMIKKGAEEVCSYKIASLKFKGLS